MLLVTSVPGRAVPRQLTPYDKIAHFALYALFALLLTRDAAQTMGRWRAAALAALIAIAFGAADEWHQKFISGRSSDVADWRADSFGALGGALLFVLYLEFRRPRVTLTR